MIEYARGVESAKDLDTLKSILSQYIRRGSGPSTSTITEISSNTTLSDEIILYKGDGYNIEPNITLTINGPFSAPLTQVFYGSGTVVFGAGSVTEVYPDWWKTNTTPGTTDMTAAINAAIASMGSGTVYFLPTEYAISTTIKSATAQHPINLQGSSCYYTGFGTRIKWIGGNGDSMVELNSYMTLKDMFIYNGNSATTLVGVDVIGNVGQPKTTNILSNVHVKSCAIGFGLTWAYYTSLYNCRATYCGTGIDMGTEANNIDMYGCQLSANEIGISGFSSTGTSQILFQGGSIEANTVYGIKCSAYCQAWAFVNTYFESNHQHLLNGYVSIFAAHLNHEGKDGGTPGVNPAFDIAGAMDIVLDIATMSTDVTQLFTLSGATSAYASDSIEINARYHKAAVAKSLFESTFLRDGYINNNSYTVIESPWYNASGAIDERIISVGEKWKVQNKKLVAAYLVVDTAVVVAGTFTVTVEDGGSYKHVNSVFDADKPAGIYALTLIPSVAGVAETVSATTYFYKVTGTGETSGKYKVVLILI